MPIPAPTFTVAGLVGDVFKDFDANKDGSLTSGELAPLKTALKLSDAAYKAAFAKLDLNGDGRITVAELTSVLDRADGNHDGKLTLAELTASVPLIGSAVDHFAHHIG